MTLHACVLGIDGAGKTTATGAAAEFLALHHGLVAASAGESFAVVRPRSDEGPAPPVSLPLAAPLAAWAKRAAKRVVDLRALYPPVKLLQMLLQDSAAWRLGRSAGADVVVSDGNLLLSASGRAGNYRRTASRGEGDRRERPEAEHLAALFACLCDGEPLPPPARARLPPLGAARVLCSGLRALGLRPAWLPDAVVFLDLDPEAALARIRARGIRVDAHENASDLAQARDGYLRTLAGFARYRGDPCAVLVLDVTDRPAPDVARTVADFLAERSRRHAPGPIG